ncbi:transporter, major facilitator family protein [Trichinella nativa]|uniref:Transporter, major facilitator family protein n=1 Tax=Trichinella nativa TaxID=6335 RepID=A0A1Y3ER44_9BILA|nr:transporter, major facilitator family protein [Trichinella nativa]
MEKRCEVIERKNSSSSVEKVENELLDDEEDLSDLRPVPPDGGFGWVIVFASFMANTIVDGIAYSFGIILPELHRHYKGTVQTAAWVGSLLTGMYMLVGPVAGGLVNKFGARFVCIVGAVIAMVGFIISIWAPTLPFLMFSYGILGGIGFGFIYLPACVFVSYYFDKKRALATGIAVSGSGFGTFVFAPMTVALIDHFGWQGVLWILAGFIANCAVCGALLWPLPAPRGAKQGNHSTIEQQQHNIENEKSQAKNSKQNKKWTSTDENVVPLVDAFKMRKTLSFQHISDKKQAQPTTLRCISAYLIYNSASDNSLDSPFDRPDVFYPGSVANLPPLLRTISSQSKERKVTGTSKLEAVIEELVDADLLPNRMKNKNKKKKKSKRKLHHIPRTISRVLLSMIDYHLLKHPSMLILSIANIVGMLGFYVPFVFLASYSDSLGNTKEQSSLLLSVIGITNTIGRVIFGWVSDQHWVTALTINNIALLLCGLLTCLCVVFTTYELLILYSTLFGFFIAPYVSLSAVILVEELGLENLTNSFGLLTLARGISAMVGSPLGGELLFLEQYLTSPDRINFHSSLRDL